MSTTTTEAPATWTPAKTLVTTTGKELAMMMRLARGGNITYGGIYVGEGSIGATDAKTLVWRGPTTGPIYHITCNMIELMRGYNMHQLGARAPVRVILSNVALSIGREGFEPATFTVPDDYGDSMRRILDAPQQDKMPPCLCTEHFSLLADVIAIHGASLVSCTASMDGETHRSTLLDDYGASRGIFVLSTKRAPADKPKGV